MRGELSKWKKGCRSDANGNPCMQAAVRPLARPVEPFTPCGSGHEGGWSNSATRHSIGLLVSSWDKLSNERMKSTVQTENCSDRHLLVSSSRFKKNVCNRGLKRKWRLPGITGNWDCSRLGMKSATLASALRSWPAFCGRSCVAQFQEQCWWRSRRLRNCVLLVRPAIFLALRSLECAYARSIEIPVVQSVRLGFC